MIMNGDLRCQDRGRERGAAPGPDGIESPMAKETLTCTA